MTAFETFAIAVICSVISVFIFSEVVIYLQRRRQDRRASS